MGIVRPRAEHRERTAAQIEAVEKPNTQNQMTEAQSDERGSLSSPKTWWRGVVVGLHLAPRAMLPMRSVETLKLIAGEGVEGDRYLLGTGALSESLKQRGLMQNRQVTLFEEEVLEALRRDHGVELTPEEHRLNITTRGVPLNHLIGRRFRVGSTVLLGVLAAPCKHLDEVLGRPISYLLVNRRGLNAKVIEGGRIWLDDVIEPL